jgi:hypothetical protein
VVASEAVVKEVVVSEVAAMVVVTKEVAKEEVASEAGVKEAVAEVAVKVGGKEPSPEDNCNAVVEKAKVDILTTERKSFVYLQNTPIVMQSPRRCL